MDVDATVFTELLHCPLVGLVEVRRGGEAVADFSGEVVEGLGGLAVVFAFLDNFIEDD